MLGVVVWDCKGEESNSLRLGRVSVWEMFGRDRRTQRGILTNRLCWVPLCLHSSSDYSELCWRLLSWNKSFRQLGKDQRFRLSLWGLRNIRPKWVCVPKRQSGCQICSLTLAKSVWDEWVRPESESWRALDLLPSLVPSPSSLVHPFLPRTPFFFLYSFLWLCQV